MGARRAPWTCAMRTAIKESLSRRPLIPAVCALACAMACADEPRPSFGEVAGERVDARVFFSGPCEMPDGLSQKWLEPL